MVDAVVSPTGTGDPSSWTVFEIPDNNMLGLIEQSGNLLTVLAFGDNCLTGVSPGPYPSKEKAMDAIAAKIGGRCLLGM